MRLPLVEMTPWVLVFMFLSIAFASEKRCLPESIHTRIGAWSDGQIIIQMSDDVLNQIESHIFKIFLKEELGYRNVFLHWTSYSEKDTEGGKLLERLLDIDGPKLNLGVWMPADFHSLPPDVEMAGRLSTGYFGWFIARGLIQPNDLQAMHLYTIFKYPNMSTFKQFVFDESILNEYADGNDDANNSYVPEQCIEQRCVTLLAADRMQTNFVIKHIKELKLFVKVKWLGANLQAAARHLYKEFSRNGTENAGKNFVLLHYSPSLVIDTDIEYVTITMPACKDIMISSETLCQYETIAVLKYYSTALSGKNGLNFALHQINFNRTQEEWLLRQYHSYTNGSAINDRVVDDVACKWLKNNGNWSKWVAPLQQETIYIGGIYPNTHRSNRQHEDLVNATTMAEIAINMQSSTNFLPNVKLEVTKSDGGCSVHTVMHTFLNYYIQPKRILGVLGPPCSEAVEPIAGLSKIGMTVISYSVEGASFTDREKYPYFFRTIGDNRQYEQVYVKFFAKMNWHRAVAFTEDGQKYTEYISQMEPVLKENGIDLTNKKFSKYFTTVEMRSYLQDLISKKTNIIIADIYDEQALMVLCEAYKLKMTAQNGYVWFLPVWLQKDWSDHVWSINVSCSPKEITEMLNGHFSLAHEPFAADDAIMQENRTVAEWKQSFRNRTNSPPDNDYIGFVYDAVWVYAYALDKLIKEWPPYLDNLHSDNTTKRLMQFISNTSFDGLSGRIEFDEGGTRFTNINVVQWINGKHERIANFYPNISEATPKKKRSIVGGQLHLDETKILWITANGAKPSDGTETCSVQSIVNITGMDCTSALYMITALLCIVLVVLVSMASFAFWKRRYDRKLMASAKVMRNFGIDLLSLSSMPANTLDKWEVSKDRIVINRRLGEGAFGTVYGGEAQIDDNGWTAVAVKTLKKGSSTEDRLDFLSEAEAMKRFDHTNVIKLLGVCLQTEPIYTIMEFMLYGDLKTFLLARRHLANGKITEESDISPKRLTIMALDVARALSYLADMKYVHRDIACRNCLVNAQRIVKLGDFGMARPTFENDYYRFSRKGLLPVRWMAPESLTLGIFTPASDVWSFGILLYEIITFGSFPFQGMTNLQVLEHLKNGNTLVIPSGIKPQLEGLMNACWNLSYKKRPSACEVADFISNYPKLVTPSLDVPLASVEMPGTESDQLELIPGLRRSSTQPTDFDKTVTYKNVDGLAMSSTLPNGITLREFKLPKDEDDDDFGPSQNRNVSNSSYIEPLLQYDGETSNSTGNLSLRRYVPMYGFKHNDRTTPNESTTVM